LIEDLEVKTATCFAICSASTVEINRDLATRKRHERQVGRLKLRCGVDAKLPLFLIPGYGSIAKLDLVKVAISGGKGWTN
jgi:hypothetical protein